MVFKAGELWIRNIFVIQCVLTEAVACSTWALGATGMNMAWATSVWLPCVCTPHEGLVNGIAADFLLCQEVTGGLRGCVGNLAEDAVLEDTRLLYGASFLRLEKPVRF